MMDSSVSQVKLYGPGIPSALKQLEKLATDLMLGKFDIEITLAKPFIGDAADYEFVWEGVPTNEETLDFIEVLDKLILECQPTKYTITTRIPESDPLLARFDSPEVTGIAYTFLRIYGPSLSQAIRLLNEKITEHIAGIKSKTGVLLGTKDYAIEWLYIPTVNDIIAFLTEVDIVLSGTGCVYKVSTKSKLKTRSDPSDKIRSEQSLQIDSPPPVISVDTGKNIDD
jgi:hypothetical protein